MSPSHRQQQRAALALFLARGWAALLCWKLGHVIECEGHAGPESGSEEFWCSRCGWSHEIIYY